MRTREFVAIILGYLCLFAVAFSVQTVAYLIMGAERVYDKEFYQVSHLWIAVALAAGLAGAMFGGYICRFTAGSAKAVFCLAGLILLVEFSFGIYALQHPVAVELQEGDVKMLNAMNLAVSPQWLIFVHACICSVGVLAGAGMTKTPLHSKMKENGQVLETGI